MGTDNADTAAPDPTLEQVMHHHREASMRMYRALQELAAMAEAFARGLPEETEGRAAFIARLATFQGVYGLDRF